MTAGDLPLPLAEIARLAHRSPRWFRRRLDRIVHFRPDDGQILIKLSDYMSFLEQFRHEPVTPAAKGDLDEILGPVLPRRRRAAR